MVLPSLEHFLLHWRMGSMQSKLSPYTRVHIENVPWVFYNCQLLTTWQLLCFILDFPSGVPVPESRHSVRIPLFVFSRNAGLIVFHLVLLFEKMVFSVEFRELFICLSYQWVYSSTVLLILPYSLKLNYRVSSLKNDVPCSIKECVRAI